MALIESKWKKIRDMIPLQYVCMCTSNSLVRGVRNLVDCADADTVAPVCAIWRFLSSLLLF